MADTETRADADGALKPAAAHPELKPAELRAVCPLTSDELVGQQRALDAIKLAIGINAPGYNVFVTGLRTRDERGSVLQILGEKAASMPTPGDWVYVNN